VSASGRTIERATGRVVANVEVEFARTGGVTLREPVARARSGSDGWFLLDVAADSGGEVVGDLTVRPPAPHAAYTVRGVRLRTTTTRGEGTELGRVVVDPFIAWVGELHARGIAGRGIVPGATVTFRRIGGARIDPETQQWDAGDFGRFYFSPRLLDFGAVQGELTVSAPSLPKSYVVPVTIEPEWRDRIADQVAVVNLGAALQYVGEVYRRGDLRRTAGLRVEFRRTGGIPVEPEVYTSVTTDYGLFLIAPTPLAEGEVVGDLTIHVPEPEPPLVIRGVRLRTSEEDGQRVAGRWGYGAQLFAQVEYAYRTTDATLGPGIEVVARRVGGARVSPDSLVDTTNAFGRTRLQFATLEEGDTRLELEVRLRAPYKPDTVTGLVLRGRRDDEQVFGGRWPIGRWLPAVGSVQDAETLRGIAGARLAFTRTGGVAVDRSPYTFVTDSFGLFPIRPLPLDDGEVVGDLAIDVPAPYRDTVITGLRLRTSTDDTLRLVGVWRFRRQ
jgi:hypothetical protein